jgi:hypothetical protein
MLQDISFDEVDAVKNLFVVYRIRGEDLIPLQVTSELQIHPTTAFQKGEKYIGQKYDPISKSVLKETRERPLSVWDIDTHSLVHLKRVEDHIEYLLKILEPHSEQILHYLNQSEKYLISFYIRWESMAEHGSYVLSSDFIKRMGGLCHFVEFSFIANFEQDGQG